MAVWTGSLSDVGLGHLVGFNPEIQFHLNAPQMSADGTVFATKPAKTTPAASGVFSVDLVDTSVMMDDAWLEMHVVWQEPGANPGEGYSPVDVHIKTPLRTNSSGGPITSAFGSVKNLGMVYLSLTAPSLPLPGILWWKTDPSDPNNVNMKNTGQIYRWENL